MFLRKFLLFALAFSFVTDDLFSQDNVFRHQLHQSDYLRFTMKPDSGAMAFVRWQNKTVLKSRQLKLATDFNALKLKGPGEIKLEKQLTRTGEGSILLETPTSLAVKNPSNRSYAFAEVVRPIDHENLAAFNRISTWVNLDAPGFYSAFVGITLYNEGKHVMPTPGRFEGQHYVTVYPGQWQQIIWEIPDIYRDNVTGISVSIMLGGSPEGATDHFKLYVDDLRLETVAPENTRGFDLRKNAVAYSHSGYLKDSRKQAIVQNVRETHFQIIGIDGKAVLDGAAKPLMNGFYLIDFTSVTSNGQYKIKIDNLSSAFFSIGDQAYIPLAWRTLNFFFAERCGFDQPGIHQVCHKDIFSVHPNGQRMIINGGWHDAADLTQGVGNTARGIISMLQLANSVKRKDSLLYKRLIEEARWGLDWTLSSRYGDGYRHGSLIVGIWTDNKIGTKDDMEAKANNSPFDNLLASIAETEAAPYVQSSDPVFSGWCRKAGIEDFQFAQEQLQNASTQKSEVELNALVTMAAMKLYSLTHDQKYLEVATKSAGIVMACQQVERRHEWAIKLHGFFYESREKKRPQAYFHQSNEDWPIQGLCMLLQYAPNHQDATKWKAACLAYADYLHDIATTVAPYAILPAAVYEVDNADFGDIYHEGARIGLPSMEEYNAQVKKGIPLGGNFYLRRFPVAYQFRGFHAVLMGKAKAAFLLADLLDDKSLRDIATRQLEYIVGFNPFAMSTIYGEGYDYPPLYGAYAGDVVGAVPVGIETFENDDEPYMPMQVNATYKEIWTHTTASTIWLLAKLLEK